MVIKPTPRSAKTSTNRASPGRHGLASTAGQKIGAALIWNSMIVPRSRLILWFALVVLPFTLLAAVEPAAAGWSLAAMAAFVGLVLVDALGARSALAGISVELPQVTRVSKDRPAKLEVRIRNQRLKSRTLQMALGLPPQIP